MQDVRIPAVDNAAIMLVTREALQDWVDARELLQPDAGLTPARYMEAAQSA